jgi:hypothetical protein
MAANSQGPRANRRKATSNNPHKVIEEFPEIQVPADLTIAETEEWVGEDPARAKAALAAEEEREHPRTTLIDKLKD